MSYGVTSHKMKRDYYYELTDRGMLLLEGAVQNDPWFLDFFFRRLAVNANPDYPDYPYVCRCGDEMNYLRPTDTPIVFTGFDGSRLFFGHSLSVPFWPDRLSYSPDGVLYHDAPVGGVGRLTPSVAVELARFIEPWGPFFAFLGADGRQLVPITPRGTEGLIKIVRPKAENNCVGCGLGNSYSLRLSFVHDVIHGSVHTWVRPDERMQGSLGITHGGYVSLLLDETMGKVLSVQGIRAPTARLNVNFRSPMNLGEEYEVVGRIQSQQGRKIFVNGEVRSSTHPGGVVAEAEALFIKIPPV